MEPYYNPVLSVIRWQKKLNELQTSPISEKDKKQVAEIYKERINNAKSHIRLMNDKLAFHHQQEYSKNGGYNGLVKFVNKQLLFGAINKPVNFEIVAA